MKFLSIVALALAAQANWVVGSSSSNDYDPISVSSSSSDRTSSASSSDSSSSASSSSSDSSSSDDDLPCPAFCVEFDDGEKLCTFYVSRDIFSGELGYYKFEGLNGDCGGTNPTLGIEKGATYVFVQSDSPTNYYHPIGFAYEPDGALLDNNELEPSISGPACCTDDTDCPADILCPSNADCEKEKSCPAPMYSIDDVYQGFYSNSPFTYVFSPNPNADPATDENFGLDDYENAFFRPFYDWFPRTFNAALYYPKSNDFLGDIFYFCHIHQGMTGRIKFIDENGVPLTPGEMPVIPYDYDVPSAYDESCGTFGLEDFQLPNAECPEKFVCDAPEEISEFAGCIDSMDCAMMRGMTTNANDGSAAALFIRQMIPHHQNAVNMCKSLLKVGGITCDDLEDEEDANCQLSVLCMEIINVQNMQIQTMQGVLKELDLPETSDCKVLIPQLDSSSSGSKSKKSGKSAKRNRD